MHWDYYTYMAQPSWFIELISLKKNLDAEFHNREQKKQEAKLRRKSI